MGLTARARRDSAGDETVGGYRDSNKHTNQIFQSLNFLRWWSVAMEGEGGGETEAREGREVTVKGGGETL